MAVTLKQIALAASVSDTVVSKILNGGGAKVRVSEVTRQKVVQIAQNMGYRANNAARMLRQGCTKTIALLHDAQEWRSSLPGPLVNAIVDALQDKGYHLMLAKVDEYRVATEDYIPKILQEFHADGLLLNFHVVQPKGTQRLIKAQQIPSVWLNSKLKHQAVYPDDFQAGCDLTQALFDLGKKRIGYIDCGIASLTPKATHYSRLDRLEGYKKNMLKHGVEPICLLLSDMPLPEQMTTIEQWIKHHNLEAIVDYGGASPLLVSYIFPKMRKTLGKNILLSSFYNEEPQLNYGSPQALIDNPALAIAALDMLINSIGNQGKSLISCSFHHKILIPKETIC